MRASHARRLCASTAFLMTSFGATAGLAQATGAPAPATPERVEKVSESYSGDIVVTARRREENVQNVPVAITAFSQQTLERKSISDPFSLNKAVPGLQVNADSGNSALPSFSIRGRGQFFGAASGSVETYFADVPLSAPYQIPTLPPQFFDLQSVQVLKGPQGTLFGRNTTGGAVLFVPAAASTDETSGYARVQGGNYDDIQVEAAVNLPFSDKAAIRVAGFEWHRKGYSRTTGGYVDPYGRLLPVQHYDNQDVTEVRATLLLKPTDSFTNSTIFTYHSDQNRSAQRLIGVNLGQPTFYGALAASSYPDFATSSLRTTRNNVDLTRRPSHTFAIINTSTYDVSDSFKIKNIFGYINASGYGNNPGTADGFPAAAVDLPGPPQQERNFQTTDELQVQGSLLDDRLTYIAGGLIDLTRQPGANDSINVTTNSFPAGELNNQFDEQFRQSRFTSQSVFGSFTYKFTDTLSLAAGIRHTWDHIKERSCEYNPGTPEDPLPTQSDATACANTVHADGTLGFATGKKTFRGLSYNAGLEWRPMNGTMLYGGYRRGYKRGGFNAKGAGIVPFDAEKVDDYYVGLKQDLQILGVPGHFNIEGFYDNYKNAQRSYLAFDLSVQALTTFVQNAPKQTYRGFDMDFVVDPTPWLELSGNYTFVDAYYGKFPDNTCTINFGAGPMCFNILGIPGGPSFVPVAAIQAINPGDQSDNPVGLVSKHKMSATARFHTDLSDGSEVAIAPTFSYQSRFYINDQTFRQPNAAAGVFGPVNSAAHGASLAPGYKLVDVRVEWNRVMGSKVDIAANVNNITNKTFITGGSGIYQLGFNNVTFGAPRMFTVEAKVHF
jgi:iron complex outermembrane recepter protein